MTDAKYAERRSSRWICGVGLALGLAASQQVKADQYFGERGAWTIRFSDEFKGCVATASYKNGTSFTFGIDGITKNQFMNFSNADWDNFPLNQNYEVRFILGRYNSFNGYFHTVKRNGLPTFENGELSDKFVDAIAGASDMNMQVEGRKLAGFSLQGTRAAFEQVFACQRSQ